MNSVHVIYGGKSTGKLEIRETIQVSLPALETSEKEIVANTNVSK